MTTTVTSFRNSFPAFASTAIYPVSSVQFWLNFATLMLNADRWGEALDMGLCLLIAHNLVLEAKANAEALAGGVPGVTTGPVASKSVDKVSINYATSEGTTPDAGHWNLTIYGTRFIKLSRMMGAGPLMALGTYCGNNSGTAEGGWSGPLTTPGFTNFS